MSADGTKAAFATASSNLAAQDGDTSYDVDVKNLTTGAVTLASSTPAGVGANGSSTAPSISADGTRVAFLSTATNLTGGSGGVAQVYVKDLRTGEVQLAFATAAGVAGDATAGAPALSRDGSRVAFSSAASNLGGPAGSVFVEELAGGAVLLASSSSTGEPANAAAANPALSADGTVVVFDTAATNLDPADSDRVRDVYRKDLTSGALSLASVTAGGVKGNGDSASPSLSDSGGRVAFTTFATNLSPDATDPDPEFGQTVFRQGPPGRGADARFRLRR